MPSKESHINLANRCQASLKCLLESEQHHSEWITTIAFYKAIHVVEAIFTEQRLSHERNHEGRENLLKRTPNLSHIFRMYRPLGAASTIARYLADRNGTAYETFDDFLTPDQVPAMMVNHYLNQIEKSSLPILGNDCGLVRCV